MIGLRFCSFLLVGFVLASCNQMDYRSNTKSESATASRLQQKTDRPSEQGAGLPGYSVYCAIDKEASQELDVGCKVVDQSQQRVRTPASAWHDYELVVTNAPEALSIEKQLPANRDSWDVIFVMQNLPLDELIELASTANFVYEGEISSGERIVADSQNTQPSETEQGLESDTPAPSDPQANLSCPNGLARGGVCYFKTTESCANACATQGRVPHRAVVDLIGSSAQDSGQLCLEVARTIEGDQTIPFNLVTGPLGLGCHIRGDGIALDQTGTNTAANPPGDIALICACE